MLTHPDRKRFEQIRAQWEAAQQVNEGWTDMVGRRVTQQPPSGDAPPHSASKFRRTLSQGLAFISNPLSQRKTTPSRQPALTPALTPVLSVTSPTTNTTSHHEDALTLSTRDPSASIDAIFVTTEKASSKQYETSNKRVDGHAALPRSRTTSFLPRPARSASNVSMDEQGTKIKFPRVAVITDSKLHALPSKIPTPSPPLSEKRVSSPRQYLPRQTFQRECRVDMRHSFVGDSTGSPSKFTSRSHTCQSLVKAATSPQLAQIQMKPDKTGCKKPTATPLVSKTPLQENIPTHNRGRQGWSHVQEKGQRRESIVASLAVSDRSTFVQESHLSRSEVSNQGAPLMTTKRFSSNHAPQQTPITAQREQSKQQLTGPRSRKPTIQPSAARLQSPPSPRTLVLNAARPGIPRSITENDMQRKTLGTPNGVGGIWRSSRVLAAANHEVRLPHSFTFHDFESLGSPPVPAIPDRYRTPSLASFFQSISSYGTHRFKMAPTTSSNGSIPERTTYDANVLEISMPIGTGNVEDTGLLHAVLSDSNYMSTARPSSPRLECLPQMASTLPLTMLETAGSYSHDHRPWSISDQQYENNTDAQPYFQVRDYMPPQYWAGRFQSRIDHWRTDAMMAELDPDHTPEGLVGACKLNQDKLASCYILAQLRDVCLTEQAANSFWEFEFQYRKQNKLFGAEYPMQPPRKQNDYEENKGAFGRAVRRLTPRKSSFVNLLKGKGWGKGDEELDESLENF
ncbi:hypothetical protein ACEQ8H_001414 [Pleosporales sp. CAS-2024a]